MPYNKDKATAISDAFNPNRNKPKQKKKKEKNESSISAFFKKMWNGPTAAEALTKGQQDRIKKGKK